MKTKMKNLFLTLLSALVLPQMAAAATVYVAKDQSTITWSTASCWTNNAIPAAGSHVYFNKNTQPCTVTLPDAGTERVAQFVVYANKKNSTYNTTTFFGGKLLLSEESYTTRLLWGQANAKAVFKDLSIGFGSNPQSVFAVDGGNASTTFDNVTFIDDATDMPPTIALRPVNNQGTATVKFVNSSVKVTDIISEGQANSNDRYLVYENSSVTAGNVNKAYNSGVNVYTYNENVFYTKLHHTVILGSNNTTSPALNVSGAFYVSSGSTLSIDTTAVGNGTYKILSAGTLTNPQKLAVSLVPNEGDKLPLVVPVLNRTTDLVLYAGAKKYTFTVVDKKELSLTIEDSDLESSVMTDGSGNVYGYVLYDAAKREYANVYTKTGTVLTWTVPTGVTSFDYYVVGGGGGGAGSARYLAGGGGGAGAVVTGRIVSVSSEYTISVGQGGSGSSAGGEKGDNEAGSNGSVSTLSDGSGEVVVKALGGGGGGAATKPAGSGGCGGGRGAYHGYSGGANGTALSSESVGDVIKGFDGGAAGDYAGGGGGGAGSAGNARTSSGATEVGGSGGSGMTVVLCGERFVLAGGGGGGSRNNGSIASGGSSVGGTGGVGRGTDNIIPGAGGNGVAGTGSGGGGAGSSGYSSAAKTAAGGAGGSGVVILRYVVPVAIEEVTWTADYTNFWYFGTTEPRAFPALTGTIVEGGSTLTLNDDYTVQYFRAGGGGKQNPPMPVGSYVCVETGKDNFTGCVTNVPFNVVRQTYTWTSESGTGGVGEWKDEWVKNTLENAGNDSARLAYPTIIADAILSNEVGTVASIALGGPEAEPCVANVLRVSSGSQNNERAVWLHDGCLKLSNASGVLGDAGWATLGFSNVTFKTDNTGGVQMRARGTGAKLRFAGENVFPADGKINPYFAHNYHFRKMSFENGMTTADKIGFEGGNGSATIGVDNAQVWLAEMDATSENYSLTFDFKLGELNQPNDTDDFKPMLAVTNAFSLMSSDSNAKRYATVDATAKTTAGESFDILTVPTAFDVNTELKGTTPFKPATLLANTICADGLRPSYSVITNGDMQTIRLTLKRDITKAVFSINPTTFVYNGNERSPTVAATWGGETITEGDAFTVEGDTSATVVGTYKLHLVGTGNYAGVTTNQKWTITSAVYKWIGPKPTDDAPGNWSDPANWQPPVDVPELENTYPDNENKTADMGWNGAWVDVDVTVTVADIVIGANQKRHVLQAIDGNKITSKQDVGFSAGSVLQINNDALDSQLTAWNPGKYRYPLLILQDCTQLEKSLTFQQEATMGLVDTEITRTDGWNNLKVVSWYLPIFATNSTLTVAEPCKWIKKMDFYLAADSHVSFKMTDTAEDRSNTCPKWWEVSLDSSTLTLDNTVPAAISNVTVKGASSLLSLTGNFTPPPANGTWSFTVPAGGFTAAPIQAANIAIQSGHKLALDLTAVAPGTYGLATATTALTIDGDLAGLEANTTYTKPGLVAQLVLLDGDKTLAVEVKRDLGGPDITATIGDAEWTGSDLTTALQGKVTVTDAGRGKTLELGTDYEVAFNLGETTGEERTSHQYVATITGTGDYEGTVEVDYWILGREFVWVGGADGNGEWDDPNCWDRTGAGTGRGWPGDGETASPGLDIAKFGSGTFRLAMTLTENRLCHIKAFEMEEDTDVTVVGSPDKTTAPILLSEPVRVNGVVRLKDQSLKSKGWPMNLGGLELLGLDEYPQILGEVYLVSLGQDPCQSACCFAGEGSPLWSVNESVIKQDTYNGGGYPEAPEFITYYCANDNLSVRIAMTNSSWQTTCGRRDANMVGLNATWSYCNSTNLTGIIANHFGGKLTIDNSVVGFQNLHDTVAKAEGYITGEEGDTFLAKGLAISGANSKFALSENATVTGTVTFKMPVGGFANDAGQLKYGSASSFYRETDGSKCYLTPFSIDTSFAGVAPVAVVGELDLSGATLTVDASAITEAGTYPLVRSATSVTGGTTGTVTGLDDGLVGKVVASDNGLDLVVSRPLTYEYTEISFDGVNWETFGPETRIDIGYNADAPQYRAYFTGWATGDESHNPVDITALCSGYAKGDAPGSRGCTPPWHGTARDYVAQNYTTVANGVPSLPAGYAVGAFDNLELGTIAVNPIVFTWSAAGGEGVWGDSSNWTPNFTTPGCADVPNSKYHTVSFSNMTAVVTVDENYTIGRYLDTSTSAVTIQGESPNRVTFAAVDSAYEAPKSMVLVGQLVVKALSGNGYSPFKVSTFFASEEDTRDSKVVMVGLNEHFAARGGNRCNSGGLRTHVLTDCHFEMPDYCLDKQSAVYGVDGFKFYNSVRTFMTNSVILTSQNPKEDYETLGGKEGEIHLVNSTWTAPKCWGKPVPTPIVELVDSQLYFSYNTTQQITRLEISGAGTELRMYPEGQPASGQTLTLAKELDVTFPPGCTGFTAGAPVKATSVNVSGLQTVNVDLRGYGVGDYPLVAANEAMTLPTTVTENYTLDEGFVARLILMNDDQTLAVEVKRDLTALTIGIGDLTYTSKTLIPALTFKSGDVAVSLVKDIDYQVEFSDVIGRADDTVTAMATIRGIGKWTGEESVDYRILSTWWIWDGPDDGVWADPQNWYRVGVGKNSGYPNAVNPRVTVAQFTNGIWRVKETASVQYISNYVDCAGCDLTLYTSGGNYRVANWTYPTVINGILRLIGPGKVFTAGDSFAPLRISGEYHWKGVTGGPAMCNALEFIGDDALLEVSDSGPFEQTGTDTYSYKSFINRGNYRARIAITNTTWTMHESGLNVIGDHSVVSISNSTIYAGVGARLFGGDFTIIDSTVALKNVERVTFNGDGKIPESGQTVEYGDELTTTSLLIGGEKSKLALSGSYRPTGTVMLVMPAGGFKAETEVYTKSTYFTLDTGVSGVAPIAVAKSLDLSGATLTVDASAITEAGTYPLVRAGTSVTVGTAGTTEVTVADPWATYGHVEPAETGVGLDLVVEDRIALTGVSATNQTYASAVRTPDFGFTTDSGAVEGLVEGVDYAVAWTNEAGVGVSRDDLVAAGTYTATVTGINRYKGTVTCPFTIDRKVLTIEGLEAVTREWDDTPLFELVGTPVLTGVIPGDDVTTDPDPLPMKGRAWSLSGTPPNQEWIDGGNNKLPGIRDVYLEIDSKCPATNIVLQGEASANYVVTPPVLRGEIRYAAITSLKLKSPAQSTYDGADKRSSITNGAFFVANGKEWRHSSYIARCHYKFYRDEACGVEATDLTSVGTIWVVLEANDSNISFVGAATNTYTITPRSLENCTITVTAFVEQGKDPTVTVTDTILDGVPLAKGVDYDVTYDTSTPGATTVTITGKGNYSGTATRDMTVMGNVFTWVGPETGGRWMSPENWEREGAGTTGHGWPGEECKGDSADVAIHTAKFNPGAYSVVNDVMTLAGNTVYPLKKLDVSADVNLTLIAPENVGSGNAKLYSYYPSEVYGTLHLIGQGPTASYHEPFPFNLGASRRSDGVEGLELVNGRLVGFPAVYGQFLIEDVRAFPVGGAMAFGKDGAVLNVTDSKWGNSSQYGEDVVVNGTTTYRPIVSLYCSNDNWKTTLAMTNSTWTTTADGRSGNMVGRNATLSYKDSTHLTGILAKHFGGTLTLDNSVVGYQVLVDSDYAKALNAAAGSVVETDGRIFHAKEITLSGEDTKFYVSADLKLEGSVVVTMPAGGFLNVTNSLAFDTPGDTGVPCVADTAFSTNAPIAVGGTLDLRYGVFDVDATAMNEVPVGDYPLAAAKEGFKMPEAGIEQLTMQIKEPSNRHYRASLVTNVTDDATILALRLEWAYPTYATGEEPPRIVIEDDWVKTATGLEPSVENYAAISGKLLEVNAYGFNKWQAYVAGFAANEAATANGCIIALPDKNTLTQRIAFGNWPAQSRTNETSGMLFRLEESTQSDTGFVPVAVTNAPVFDVALPGPAETTKYYRIQIEFRPRELNWLWFKALEDSTLKYRLSKRGSSLSGVDVSTLKLEYTLDYGMTWQPFVIGETRVTLPKEEAVLIRARERNEGPFANYSPQMTGALEVGGDLMSLISRDRPLTVPSNNCFARWLQSYKNDSDPSEDEVSGNVLRSARRLRLPATQITEDCYYLLFADHNELSDIPLVIPAKTAYKESYKAMFGSNAALTNTDVVARFLVSKAVGDSTFDTLCQLGSTYKMTVSMPFLTDIGGATRLIYCILGQYNQGTVNGRLEVGFTSWTPAGLLIGESYREPKYIFGGSSGAGVFVCPQALLDYKVNGKNFVETFLPTGWTVETWEHDYPDEEL